MLALFAIQIQKFQGELHKGVKQTRTLELLTTGQAILISAQQFKIDFVLHLFSY